MGNMRIKKTIKGAAIALGVLGVAGIVSASTVNVDLDEEHQVIRGFGGMVHNTWQGGQGLSEADAKLAFGTGDGQIGLNTLRIPVNQNSNDFNKEVQAAKYAKAVAGKDFILFATPWTSPYATGGGAHVSSANYQKYTDHLNSFAEYMKNQGVPLYAISFQNEPDYCHNWACMTADEIYNYTKGYADQLRKHGTKVISAESFAYQKNQYDKVLQDGTALKNWDILGAHFYASSAKAKDNFFQYDLADQKKVERWMTEHYTESQGSGNDWREMRWTGDQANPNVYDTVRAMDVGYEIHRGLAIGNFSQYTWWYIKRCYGLIMAANTNTSSPHPVSIPQGEINKVSKRGYVLSQYARFVRPGAIRVGATINPEPEVYASAYKSAGGDSVIVVLVNRDYGHNKTVTVNVPGANIENFHMYTTSEAKNAQYEGEVEVKNGSVTITMDAGNTSNKDCIVTLVGVGPQIKVPREPFGGTAVELPAKIELENFDVPGVGSGNKTYYDTESEKKGDADYRNDLGVDIVMGGSGMAVGYTNEGEWLEYTVNVATAGKYKLTLNAASGSTTSSVQFLADGNPITDVIAIPQTAENDWSVYQEIEGGDVELEAGTHIIRLAITGSYVNIDWFMLQAYDAEGSVVKEVMAIAGKDLHLDAPTSATYDVFDLRGKKLATFTAKNMSEAIQLWKNGSIRGNKKSTEINLIRSRANGRVAKVHTNY